MGILVVQDVQLGALIAMIPLLCFQTASGVTLGSLLRAVAILCITMFCLLLLCRIVSQFLIDRLFRCAMYTHAHTNTNTHTHTHTHTHIQHTVNRESFIGLNFCGCFEKREKFSCEFFALSINVYSI